ncbi:RHS repeat-associated core domain-containing protein, partial [Myxococcus sp. AB025B]|uniref:RHS repeat-associated core domain-containing protein n=1 Tax=Myxococcus sp. AB025B TaxID=2562794 RepID=UPI001141B6C7
HVPSENQSSVGFTGHAWDAAAGLTYAQQRWYDGKTGRFLSEDSVGAESYLDEPMGMQPWGYGNANPLTHTDPDGRSSCISGESHSACELRLALSGRWGSSPFYQGDLTDFRGPYERMEEERQRELQKSVRGAFAVVGVGLSLAAPPVALALLESGAVSGTTAAVGLWAVETGASTAVDYGAFGHVTPGGVAFNAATAGLGAWFLKAHSKALHAGSGVERRMLDDAMPSVVPPRKAEPVDPVLDSDVVMMAFKAHRGSTNPRHVDALKLLGNDNYLWVITPTGYREILNIKRSQAAHRRFLRKFKNVVVLTGENARNLRNTDRFKEVEKILRDAANKNKPGLGDRARRGDHSHYNDIIHSGFAEALGIPFVSSDGTFLRFAGNHGRKAKVNGIHYQSVPEVP